jgi:hypothetical protein
MTGFARFGAFARRLICDNLDVNVLEFIKLPAGSTRWNPPTWPL